MDPVYEASKRVDRRLEATGISEGELTETTNTRMLWVGLPVTGDQAENYCAAMGRQAMAAVEAGADLEMILMGAIERALLTGCLVDRAD
jgi:hypothetical protein